MIYKPLDIKKIVGIIALDSRFAGTTNYLKGSDLVDLFNAVGFKDAYENSIVAEGMVPNPSRTQYVKQRVSDLADAGRIDELIKNLIAYVKDSNSIVNILRKEVPELLNGIDLSQYDNPFTAPRTVFDKLPKGKNPIVFISYSWDSDEHKEWVKNFALGLRERGIFVLLDQFYEEGGDLVNFMISGIRNADRVLVIGTPTYKEKAEKTSSGVRQEDQIINIDLYYQSDSTKYIPCLRHGSFESSFTQFIGVRKGFDFSNDNNFSSEINRLSEKLINPTYSLPPLPPIYGNIGMNSDNVGKKIAIITTMPVNTELFSKLYIPVFDKILEFVTVEDYSKWMRMLANDGESEMYQWQYNKLDELSKYCYSRMKNEQFKTFDILIENLGELTKDFLTVYRRHWKSLPDGRYRIDHFFHNDEGNQELTNDFLNEVFLVSDYCLEMTRLMNLILQRIRSIIIDYRVDIGLLYIEGLCNDRPIEYIDSEKIDKPYPGEKNFLNDRLKRQQSFGYYPNIKNFGLH